MLEERRRVYGYILKLAKKGNSDDREKRKTDK
jgi:hypothetical protein